MKNNGIYKVGKVTDFVKKKGWFFGHFATDPLLQSNLVEVGWQNISNKKAVVEDKHLHTSSVEINIIISGEVRVSIDGNKHDLKKGDFYIIWPESIIEKLEESNDTEVIVVRAPSVNDKVILR